MSLYENLIALVNKYFYKTEEKPMKYNEWLTNEYVNGKWYICEEAPTIVIPTITNATYVTRNMSGQYSFVTTINGENIPIDADINISLQPSGLEPYNNDIAISHNSITFLTMTKSPTSITINIPSYFDEENNILYVALTQTITPTQET